MATASLSISVVTLAELRAGHAKARWGVQRRGQVEQWLRQFPWLSVDEPVADAWAALRDATRRAGRTCSTNDLWIAATGFVRRTPVVTCDRGFLALRSLGVDVICLPRRATTAAAGND
jgi:predicted nucleic acid-binding protein